MGVKTQKRPDLAASAGGSDLDVRKAEPVAATRTPRFNGLKTLGLLATGGLTMLGLLTLVNLGRNSGQLLGRVGSLFRVEEPPAQTDIRSLVVQQVRNASELTTAIYSMESVVPASRERTLGGYVIGKTTLLYIAHGEVRAGVDLAALRPEDVQVTPVGLTLRLPSPRILDSKIDVNRSKVYDYDRGFMGLGPDVAPELQELAQRETLAKIVETACTDGVLQSANDRAKLAVDQLLATAGYAQVSVEIQPPAADACTVPNAVLPPSSPEPGLAPNPAPNLAPSPLPSSNPEVLTAPDAASQPSTSPTVTLPPSTRPIVPLPAPPPQNSL